MIFRLSLLFLGACLFTQLKAQDKQYIVKLNRDTIRGKLRINPVSDNSNHMFFKGDDGSKGDIRPLRVTYVYYDEEYQFRSVPFFENQRHFMRIIKEEKNISYYNYIHKRDNSLLTTKVVVKPNGEFIEFSAMNFRKKVTEFLKDCPEIVARLEAKKYRYKEHEQLFADYNDCGQKLIVSNSTPASTATNAALATTISTQTESVSIDDSQQEKLSSVEEFRKYVTTLQDFEYSSDVLEWLSDIETRIRQNREIPNYLWSSLNEMSEEHTELQRKAEDLKKDLGN